MRIFIQSFLTWVNKKYSFLEQVPHGVVTSLLVLSVMGLVNEVYNHTLGQLLGTQQISIPTQAASLIGTDSSSSVVVHTSGEGNSVVNITNTNTDNKGTSAVIGSEWVTWFGSPEVQIIDDKVVFGLESGSNTGSIKSTQTILPFSDFETSFVSLGDEPLNYSIIVNDVYELVFADNAPNVISFGAVQKFGESKEKLADETGSFRPRLKKTPQTGKPIHVSIRPDKLSNGEYNWVVEVGYTDIDNYNNVDLFAFRFRPVVSEGESKTIGFGLLANESKNNRVLIQNPIIAKFGTTTDIAALEK